MNKLVSRQPATVWQDALPLGNGKTGALVFGGIAKETVVFNNEKLYLPFDNTKDCLVDKAEVFKTVRDEVLNGNYLNAEKILRENYSSELGISPYQPLCSLTVISDIKGEKSEYERTLSFEKAEAKISFKADGRQYKRRQFVSRTDNMFVMELNYPIKTNAQILLTRADDDNATKKQTAFSLDCVYKADKSKFGARMKILTDGKTQENDDKINVTGFKKLTIFITLYAFDKSIEPLKKDYGELFKKHYMAHRELYGKIKADFGYKTRYCTEELLLRASYKSPHPALYEIMFNYSRYLFICSAVGGNYPANLQGIWNGDYKPIWESDFHNDENIQMNYWQAPMLGNAQALKTFVDFYFSFFDDYKYNAKKLFGCNGIYVPLAQTLSGKALEFGLWNVWISAAGWLAQHFYEYYLYTGDKKILKDKIIPFMKETAEFYKSFMIIKDGKAVFAPSMSPENTPRLTKTETNEVGCGFNIARDKNASQVAVNPTMDIAVAKELLTNLCSALKVTKEDSSEYKKLLDLLPEYEINKDGVFREWLYDGLYENYQHRHMSHLYPLFPGCEINEKQNAKYLESIKKAVDMRLKEGITSQTGWSLVHMALIYDRLLMGNDALNCLKILLRTCVGNNLFTYHNDKRPQGNTMVWENAPFQIDANLGFSAAVGEMFLYSSQAMLSIAPSVPKLFENAKISGLCAKNGLTVNIRMKKGHASATVISPKAQTVNIKINGKIKKTKLKKGKNLIK